MDARCSSDSHLQALDQQAILSIRSVSAALPFSFPLLSVDVSHLHRVLGLRLLKAPTGALAHFAGAYHGGEDDAATVPSIELQPYAPTVQLRQGASSDKMDLLSAVAGSTQIAVYCTKCIISITKWINLVRTVDQRLEDCKQEVSILEQTYKNLRADLKKPTLIEAAREADRSSGGTLWKQVATTLENCDERLKAMMAVVEHIDKVPGSGLFVSLRSSVMRQINESLKSSDLFRLRMRIPLFNSSLVSTMQMINITLQLHHQDLSTANQNVLLKEIAALRQTVEYLTSKVLLQPGGTRSLRGSTLLNCSAAEDTVYVNLETYAGTIRTFLSDASVRASKRSGSSTILGQPLTATGQANINDWVQLPEQNGGPADPERLNYDTIDLRLTLGYIQNGQPDAEGGNFLRAEANFPSSTRQA